MYIYIYVERERSSKKNNRNWYVRRERELKTQNKNKRSNDWLDWWKRDDYRWTRKTVQYKAICRPTHTCLTSHQFCVELNVYACVCNHRQTRHQLHNGIENVVVVFFSFMSFSFATAKPKRWAPVQKKAVYLHIQINSMRLLCCCVLFFFFFYFYFFQSTNFSVNIHSIVCKRVRSAQILSQTNEIFRLNFISLRLYEM